MECDLKPNHRVKHFFLLNSTNIALLLSTITVIDAKIGNEAKLINIHGLGDSRLLFIISRPLNNFPPPHTLILLEGGGVE